MTSRTRVPARRAPGARRGAPASASPAAAAPPARSCGSRRGRGGPGPGPRPRAQAGARAPALSPATPCSRARPETARRGYRLESQLGHHPPPAPHFFQPLLIFQNIFPNLLFFVFRDFLFSIFISRVVSIFNFRRTGARQATRTLYVCDALEVYDRHVPADSGGAAWKTMHTARNVGLGRKTFVLVVFPRLE